MPIYETDSGLLIMLAVRAVAGKYWKFMKWKLQLNNQMLYCWLDEMEVNQNEFLIYLGAS